MPSSSFTLTTLFQSTPLVAERRCVPGRPSEQGANLVSIHAPRCREAMLIHGPVTRPITAVSIHAPRCREAMQIPADPRRLFVIVSIHAPRCREAMRATKSTSPTSPTFQSTPLVAERRCPQSGTGHVIPFRVSIHAPRCREAMRGV